MIAGLGTYYINISSFAINNVHLSFLLQASIYTLKCIKTNIFYMAVHTRTTFICFLTNYLIKTIYGDICV